MKQYQRAFTLCILIAVLAASIGGFGLPTVAASMPEQPLAMTDPVDVSPQSTTGNRIYFPAVQKPLPVIVLPPGKQPVGGGHTMPRWTYSYYIMTTSLQAHFDLGCALGLDDLNTPGTQDNLVILDYGSPKQINGVQGASLLLRTGFATTQQIADAVKNFGWGYYVCTGQDMQSRLRIGIGTTNFPTSENPSVTYEHGLAWALLVNQVNDWLKINTTNATTQQVDAVGANDIELAWNSYENTRKWLDGYDAANGYMMYNFGALPGCPRFSNPGAQCGSYPYVWSREQVWYVIYGAGPVYSLPEIYARNGVNAEQWYLMSVYGYQVHGAPVGFVGTLTNYTACRQVGGCGTGNSAIDNTPVQGWTQLYNLLNNDPRTAQGLRWASDIAWTNTSGKVDPFGSLAGELSAAAASLDEMEAVSRQSLFDSLQNASLSAEARRSLEEKYALSERPAVQVAPASKERPVFLQSTAGLPLVDTSEGIVEGSEGLVRPSQASVSNMWSGMVENAYVQVLAGVYPDAPDQGILIVIALEEGNVFPDRLVVDGPSGAGGLRILERQGDALIIAAADGQTLRFHLKARTLTE